MLIKRLNEVSDSALRPCYVISRERSLTGVFSPKRSGEEKSLRSILWKCKGRRVGNRDGKMRSNTDRGLEDRKFSAKSTNRNIVINFPLVSRNECKSGFFNERYLRGLRIVPVQQESTGRSLRKTSIPQTRRVVYSEFSAQTKQIIGNSIEVQTAISDEELEYLKHKNAFP